jgi:DNA-binding SARP family transcriptional activator/WD40 repeat protein
MELHVLGPVEASADGRSLPLGGPKPRAVLAMLAIEANRTVTADHLIDGLWGERAPASAAKLVQTYVWRLRTALGEDSGARILTHGRGYELRIDPESVDVLRFGCLLAAANRAEAAGEPAEAAREALRLWRGPALSDVADHPFAAAEIRQLEELRVEAAELAVAADLAAGRHQEVTATIGALIDAHPLRERLHAQRILALYRCGRQADALGAYREARRTLVEQVGVEPGPELQRLHAAILRQDPSLDVAVRELPHELDATGSPPLAGRDTELAWLRARCHAGALVTLVGAQGSGKTRLAAEIAGELHRKGREVLYVAGTGPPEAALAAIARARAPGQPTLLVVDDADRGGADVLLALRELRGAAAQVLATGRDAATLAQLRSSDTLELPPLDAAAVRQIALLYAPTGTAADPPVDVLLDASRGVPRRVHELASEWARQAAARRVDAVAGRAAAGRTQARALEAELAGSVVDLASTRERAARVARAERDQDAPVVCPFKGLAPFDVDDADYFFGRERLVAELIARLAGSSLVAVVGPSGSGKSSVVRAGLLPALADGVLPGSERWARGLIRPGEHPMRELRGAVARFRGEGRSVLVVDQFEELFTACSDASERSRFVEALLRAARAPDSGSIVVLALRADFYGRCAAYPELSAELGAGHVLVGPMTHAELGRAIELPAQRARLHLEPELVERLLADCEGEPGALPLLSTALVELWQQRDGRRLPLAAYERTGGVRGAVARLAEATFERLDHQQQDVARRILLRLAGEDVHGAPVARRVPLTELDGDGDGTRRRVLDVLAESRMITAGAGAVEVAHEALLREWPRLRGWLDEDAEGRRLHLRLSQAAHEWSQGGRDRGDLYRGARLATALEWRPEHEPELNAIEQQFLDASRVAGERARRRLRAALGGVLALLALATGAALIALDQRGQARAEARSADAQRLSAQALSEERLDRSLLLARQAVALEDTPATRDNLLTVLRRSPAAIGFMQGDGDALNAIALHPDGRTLAVGDEDGTVMLLDAAGRRPLGAAHQISGVSPRVSALSFSPDGTRLASAGLERSGAVVDLFDGRTGRHVNQVVSFQTYAEATVHFSPDSRVLAAQVEQEEGSFSYVPRWDARTGLGRPLPQSDATLGRSSTLLGFIDSGRRLVTTSEQGHATAIRDAATLRPVRRFAAFGRLAALSPATGIVAFGGRDGTVRLLDLRTGELRTARGRHEAPVVALRFDPRGRRLVTSGRDQRLIVWDPRRATMLEALEARGIGLIQDLQVARDGRTAYSAGRDGMVVVWDLSGERRWERPFGADGTARASQSLAVSANGSRFAVVDGGGFVDLFDSRTMRRTGRIRPVRGRVDGAALAPDGRTLAITTNDGFDGTLRFWDVQTRRPLGAPQAGHAGTASEVAFSADGRWLVTGDTGTTVRAWDARRPAAQSIATGGVSDLSISPDGTTLAAALELENFDGGLQIRSLPGLELVRTVPLPIGTVARFSPDGRSLIYGDDERRIWTLGTDDWKPRGRPLKAAAPILTADMSPRGRLLATTHADGTGRLWEVATRRAIGTTLSGESDDVIGAAFMRRGSHLAVLHDSGGVVWDLRPSAWARHACAVAGRPLTRAEWENALPWHDYTPACARR